MLIDGVIECNPDNLLQKLKEGFIHKLKLDAEMVKSIKLVHIDRLGPIKQGAQKPRTIIVKFHWFGNRMTVWEARKNLQGTNIFLNEDFPKET